MATTAVYFRTMNPRYYVKTTPRGAKVELVLTEKFLEEPLEFNEPTPFDSTIMEKIRQKVDGISKGLRLYAANQCFLEVKEKK